MRIVYNRVRKPGHSIVNQASRPDRLRREGADVLPMPYQDMAHWREAAWGGWLVGADGEDGWDWGGAYEREEFPDEEEGFVVFPGWWVPALYEGHDVYLFERVWWEGDIVVGE